MTSTFFFIHGLLPYIYFYISSPLIYGAIYKNLLTWRRSVLHVHSSPSTTDVSIQFSRQYNPLALQKAIVLPSKPGYIRAMASISKENHSHILLSLFRHHQEPYEETPSLLDV